MRFNEEARRRTGCSHGEVEEGEVLIGQEAKQQLGLAVRDPRRQPCVELHIKTLFKTPMQYRSV